MENIKTIEKLSKKYSKTPFEFLKTGSFLAMKEKKRELQNEKFEIQARYNVLNAQELKIKIKKGNIAEHPGWEDYIELKNIDAEIKEIDGDIESLQEA